MNPSDRDRGIRSRVKGQIGRDGGSLRLPNGKAEVDFPAGAFEAAVDVELADISPIAPYGQFERSLLAFRVEMADAAGAAIHTLGKPATLTVSYADEDVRGINRSTLGLYHWNGETKRWEPLGGEHDLWGHKLTAEVAAFSQVGMWGDPYHVVPATIRNFETDLFSGTASVSIPLEVPPGPNGFGPKLALSYSSGRVNGMKSSYAQGSWVGVGWGLSLGSISFDSGDEKYSLELGGVGDELVDLGGGRWRTKHESFLKIEKISPPGAEPYWQVWDKSGTLYRFGYKGDTRAGSTISVNDGSRQFHKTWDGQSYGDQFYRWDLDYVEDTDGNKMEVIWEGITAADCSGSQLGYCCQYDQNAYPREIRYSLNDGGGYQRKITFDLATRADSGQNVFVKEMRKLTDIRMWVGGALVRRYHFDYEEPSGQLLLTGLTQYGSDNASALPKWTFTYAQLDFRYWDTYNPGREQRRDRGFLATADNGQGGKVWFYYEHIPAEYWAGYIGWTRQRVWKKEVFDGLSAAPLATTYAYSGFQDYVPPPDQWERSEFRGHDRVTATHPDGHVTHHHFYKGVTTNWARACEDGGAIGPGGAYPDTAADVNDNLLEGREFEAVTRVGDSASAVISRTYRRWQVVNAHPRSPGERDFLQGYNEGSSAVIRRRTDYSYDNYGNVTEKWEYGQTDAYYRRTEIDYFNMYNLTTYIVDKPRQINVYERDAASGNEVLLSRKSLYYDNLGWSQAPTQGHVSHEEDGVMGQLVAIRRYGYNRSGVYEGFPYGNTRWVRDAMGNVAETVYDSTYHTFPIKVVDPLLREVNTEYDFRLGKPTRITDPNNAVTRHAYDVFGRIAKTWKPEDDNSLDEAATIVYRYDTATVPNRATVGVRKDAGGGLWPRRRYRRVFYDGLGREVQRQTDFDTSSCLIRAADIGQLRSGVNLYNPSQAWTDQPVTTATKVKALHYTELRSAIQGLWNGISLGSLPDWSSGITPRQGSLIYLADLVDLRLWLNEYETKKPATETVWPNSAGTATLVNTHYDSLGRKSQETVPHNLPLAVLGKFNRGDWDSATPLRTQYEYDVLDRVTRVTAPGGEYARTEYLGWVAGLPAGESVVRTIDPNGHVKEHISDPFGRLVHVREYSGVSPNQVLEATTTYSYNGRDQLVRVVDAAASPGNQTSITYDILGRKTGMTDPDMGAWSYGYDSNGNLTSQTDAKGQLITFEGYDALNRPRYKKNGSLTLAEFVYDEIGGSFFGFSGLGRRTTMKFGPSLANTLKSYYDRRGRVVKEEHLLDGATYAVQSTYDALDRALAITHPNGEVVTYRYGDHGLPVSLESSVRGAIVKSASYNALGRLLDLTLGNGLVSQHRYWGIDYAPQGDARYGLLRSIVTGGLQSLTYDYDAKGNVSQLVDNNGHGSETVGFIYDHLDRLLSASAPIGESYQYDSIGNMTSRNGVSRTFPAGGQPRPHAPSSVGGQGYGYDLNGNLTGAEGRSYGYDVENRLANVSGGGLASRAFLCDGDGALRRADVNGTPTTRYVTADYQINIPTGETTVYYRFGGRAVAWRNNTTLRYLLADHLSSIRGEANVDGSEAAQRRYLPFGGDRVVTGANDLTRDERYTGQRRIESGGGAPNRELYHYGARWYLPGVGIFSQPDSKVPDPKNPQDLNRYAYVRGNPLAYVDPTGSDPRVAIAWLRSALQRYFAAASALTGTASASSNQSSLSVNVKLEFRPENIPGVSEYRALQDAILLASGPSFNRKGKLIPTLPLPGADRAIEDWDDVSRYGHTGEVFGQGGFGKGKKDPDKKAIWFLVFGAGAVAFASVIESFTSRIGSGDQLVKEGVPESTPPFGGTLQPEDPLAGWRADFASGHGRCPTPQEVADFLWFQQFLLDYGGPPSQEDWEKHY